MKSFFLKYGEVLGAFCITAFCYFASLGCKDIIARCPEFGAGTMMFIVRNFSVFTTELLTLAAGGWVYLCVRRLCDIAEFNDQVARDEDLS